MCAGSLKVCFVSFEYPPFILGGAGVYAACLCRELAKLGHEIHVVSSSTSPFPENYAENEVFVHRVPIVNRPFLRVSSFWLRLRKRYEKLKRDLRGFDLLHSNVISDFSLTKDLVEAPRVVTIHHLARTSFELINPSFLEMLLHPGGELGLVSWAEKKSMDFDKIVVTRSDRVIASSNFVKRSIISNYKVPSSRIAVTHYGVYPEDYECTENEILEVKKKFGLMNESVILFVGGLGTRKGLPVLLQAFKLISKRQKKKSKLLLVGSGEQEPIRKLADSLGIGARVVLTGFVSGAMLKRLYNACDVFVLPSFLEGFGLTLLEAMAAGKPIVASNAGGIPEVVEDGVHGKLVNPGKPEELAEAIAFLIKNPQSAKEIGEKNKKYVTRNFGWKKTAELTEKLYETLFQHKGESRCA